MVSVGVHVNTRLAFFKLSLVNVSWSILWEIWYEEMHNCAVKYQIFIESSELKFMDIKLSSLEIGLIVQEFHLKIAPTHRIWRVFISDFIILLKVRDGKMKLLLDVSRFQVTSATASDFLILSRLIPGEIFSSFREKKLLFEYSASCFVVVIIFKGTRRQFQQQRNGQRKSAENKWLQYFLRFCHTNLSAYVAFNWIVYSSHISIKISNADRAQMENFLK